MNRFMCLKINILLFALLVSLNQVYASVVITKNDAINKMVEASEKYNEGMYKEAVDIYETLTDLGYETAELFHNLGLAYFKRDELGKAILNLERAKRLQPYNRDINHNLSLVKENIESNLIPAPDFFLKRWYQSVVYLGSINFWLILHLLFLFSAVGLYYAYLFRHDLFRWHKSYTLGILVALVTLSIIFSFFTYSRALAIKRNDIGIVNHSGAALRAGAEGNSLEVMQLEEGLKVVIRDRIGTFLKVRLEDYTEGWISEDEIYVI